MEHSGSTLLRTPASSIGDAHEIVGRLTQAGFARNSIDVDGRGEDQFEVLIHVSEANRARAQQAIDNISGMHWDVPVPSTTVMLIIGGAAALAAGLLALRSSSMLPQSLPFLHGNAGSVHGKRGKARHQAR